MKFVIIILQYDLFPFSLNIHSHFAGHHFGWPRRWWTSACIRERMCTDPGACACAWDLESSSLCRESRAGAGARARHHEVGESVPGAFLLGAAAREESSFLFCFSLLFSSTSPFLFSASAGTGVHALAGPRAHTAIFAPRPRNAGISARRTPSLAKNRAYRRGFMPAETKIRGTGSE